MNTHQSVAKLLSNVIRLFLLLVLVFAGGASRPGRVSAASIWHVPGDYATIQAAINASVAGDTIIVGPGTYNVNLDFAGKNITLQSEAGAAATVLHNPTVFDGTTVSIGPNGKIIGFTISGGTAHFGAGMEVSGTGSLIKANIFQDNAQGSGGYGAAIGGNVASPTIEGNIFRNNTCDTQYTSGVDAFINASSPLITNNIFINNP